MFFSYRHDGWILVFRDFNSLHWYCDSSYWWCCITFRLHIRNQRQRDCHRVCGSGNEYTRYVESECLIKICLSCQFDFNDRFTLADTFASKVAAIQDKYADASVGNVTGSNAVNVFLGIGIAWTLAAFYHGFYGQQFVVPAGKWVQAWWNVDIWRTFKINSHLLSTVLLSLWRSSVPKLPLPSPSFLFVETKTLAVSLVDLKLPNTWLQLPFSYSGSSILSWAV